MQFKQLQEHLGLTNTRAAKLFEVNTRTVERWRVENPPAPMAVIMCLESMVNKEPVCKD